MSCKIWKCYFVSVLLLIITTTSAKIGIFFRAMLRYQQQNLLFNYIRHIFVHKKVTWLCCSVEIRDICVFCACFEEFFFVFVTCCVTHVSAPIQARLIFSFPDSWVQQLVTCSRVKKTRKLMVLLMIEGHCFQVGTWLELLALLKPHTPLVQPHPNFAPP